jgi:V8-like Glu-specific endopeptidase
VPRRKTTRLVQVAALVVAVAACAYAAPASAGPQSTQLTPGEFQEVSTGVAYITTYNCGGRPIAMGTGFLVGNGVVMTARHVLAGSCRTKVRVAGTTYTGGRWTSWWWKSPATTELVDLATLKLNGSADGHVFTFRPSSPRAGTNLSMIGYPLGNRLSLNQGKIIARKSVHQVPLLAVRMLGAEGASGSPFVDDAGRVVGILQIGLGSKDALGQRTSGVLVGLEIARWMSAPLSRALCAAYPTGGIAGCPGTTKPPPPPADFELGLAPATVSVQAGATASFVMTSKPLNGFDGQFDDVYVTGLPGGTVTVGSATSAGVPVSIQTTGIAPGTYTFTVTASGASQLHTVEGTLTVLAH